MFAMSGNRAEGARPARKAMAKPSMFLEDAVLASQAPDTAYDIRLTTNGQRITK
jgi:hypothetical protein